MVALVGVSSSREDDAFSEYTEILQNQGRRVKEKKTKRKKKLQKMKKKRKKEKIKMKEEIKTAKR